MGTDARQGTRFNIVVGIVGGFISGLVMTSVLFALDPQTAQFSVWALGSALSGASLLLVAINLPVRGRVL